MDEAHSAGVITVPAAFSPSEIQLMIDMGADIVKVFPASQLGPDYLRAVQSPLGALPLMVVGGINITNVQDYFDKGATYAGIGSGIFDPKDIEERNSARLASSLHVLEGSVSW
jgi:2-dehydro-3-deoxyphosphogluconate aldolase/(4S)-4-hydroxy-2-oxoglutarate aldolase